MHQVFSAKLPRKRKGSEERIKADFSEGTGSNPSAHCISSTGTERGLLPRTRASEQLWSIRKLAQVQCRGALADRQASSGSEKVLRGEVSVGTRERTWMAHILGWVCRNSGCSGGGVSSWYRQNHYSLRQVAGCLTMPCTLLLLLLSPFSLSLSFSLSVMCWGQTA